MKILVALLVLIVFSSEVSAQTIDIYDKNGNRIGFRVTDEIGQTTEYDSGGNRLYIYKCDGNGYITKYDASGNRVGILQKNGNTMTEYDAYGNRKRSYISKNFPQ